MIIVNENEWREQTFRMYNCKFIFFSLLRFYSTTKNCHDLKKIIRKWYGFFVTMIIWWIFKKRKMTTTKTKNVWHVPFAPSKGKPISFVQGHVFSLSLSSIQLYTNSLVIRNFYLAWAEEFYLNTLYDSQFYSFSFLYN